MICRQIPLEQFDEIIRLYLHIIIGRFLRLRRNTQCHCMLMLTAYFPVLA